jgi:chromosome segregation ATPase
MSKTTQAASLLLSLSLACGSLHAQTQRGGGGGSETQKIIQQYQQLAAEKIALQAQVTQMKSQLDAANGELTAVKKERDALKSQSGAAAAAGAQLAALRESSAKSAEQNKQRMQELISRFRETATNLRDVETDRNKLKDELRARNDAYDKCALDNLGLFEINTEVLNRYEHIGPFTKVTAVEPFTRITRTRIENLVDEYRERALELRAKAQAAEAGPTNAVPATPAPVN